MLVTHLLCREIVFRAVLKSGWLDEDGRLTASAFIRDPQRDPDGLSVNMQALTDVEGWLSSAFKKSFGVDTLHAGRIRDLKLQIGQTEQDLRDGSGHAIIAGMPSLEEDPKRAEDLATELRNISCTLDRVRRKKMG